MEQRVLRRENGSVGFAHDLGYVVGADLISALCEMPKSKLMKDIKSALLFGLLF